MIEAQIDDDRKLEEIKLRCLKPKLKVVNHDIIYLRNEIEISLTERNMDNKNKITFTQGSGKLALPVSEKTTYGWTK